ncbi:hydroxyisourate hydrolase [Shimia ponticola]|uniref:hydroxyisourate hydrolase n=1 Tax=Shimia ponticola TaxID=2582893 RepID=UPI0011BEA342|nr:hydroxyisourate hydrolase [Shimia ponticola]
MADGYLTTHVLDTARGCPAAGLRIVLNRITPVSIEELADMTTNLDGRTDGPVLPVDSFAEGNYELLFFAGDYLRRSGLIDGDTPFLDVIPIRFGISEDSHYHVPLLLSPFGYSTYRGS